MQQDLIKLDKYSRKSQLSFNVSKGAVLSIGNKNSNTE